MKIKETKNGYDIFLEDNHEARQLVGKIKSMKYNRDTKKNKITYTEGHGFDYETREDN